MLISVIIFLPLVVCLFWMHLHIVMASRTGTFAAVMCLMGAVAAFLLADCCYCDPNSSTRFLPLANNLSQLAAPCVIPLLLIYMWRIRTGSDIHTRQLLWIIAPVVLFTIAEITTALAGRPAIEGLLSGLTTEGLGIMREVDAPELTLYFYSSVIGFRIVLAIEFLLMFILFVKAARRDGFSLSDVREFFRGGEIEFLELQYFNLIPIVLLSFLKELLFRNFLQGHVWVSVVLSASLALLMCPFLFVAMFGAKKRISLRDMQNGLRFNYNSRNKTEILEEMLMDMIEEADEGTMMRIQMKYGIQLNVPEAKEEEKPKEEEEPSLAERIFSAVTRSIDEDSLMGRFEHLMMVEKIFLRNGLTLEEVADRLNSNKTYVSKMVNSTYNISFPELVNTLRIDYAEDYIVHHRDARQEDIARACGFPSASSFNNTFKRITGMPPRIWLATHDRHNSSDS